MRYKDTYPARAGNYASPLNAYVLADDTVEDILKKMMEFNISKIAVCDENFKITGGISKKQIKNFLFEKEQNTSIKVLQKYKAKDILNNSTSFALAYLGSNIHEITSAMQTLNLNLIPVVKSPWDKELRGFVKIEETEYY